ncbi:MAG: hypothetical protein ABII13_00575 [Patescibacteria group bacterium]|nr:hypothetical protein [Patescibacteria group bacterium]
MSTKDTNFDSSVAEPSSETQVEPEIKKLEDRLESEVLGLLVELLNSCGENDRRSIVMEISELKKQKKISQSDILEAINAAIRKDPNQSFWGYLSRGTGKDVIKKFPELMEYEMEGFDDFIPTDSLEASWELFQGYFSLRKKRKERNKPSGFAGDISLDTIIEAKKAKETDAGLTDKEKRDRMIDAVMLEMVFKAQRINEGNNGTILRLDIDILDEKTRELAMEVGLIQEGNNIFKLLKIYRAGDGEQEVNNQRSAYEIVNEASKKGLEVTKVPKVYSMREIKSPNKEISELIRMHAHLDLTQDRVECIVMEYLEGEDLGTYIWKEYAKQIIKKIADSKESIVSEVEEEAVAGCKTFFDIQDYIKALQQRFEPALKGRLLEFMARTPANEKEVRKESEVNVRNAKKIQDVLVQGGFVIDQSIYDKVNNTIEAFREQGLVYLDAHERNIMLVGDDVYTIDFGKCKKIKRPVTGNQDAEAFASVEDNPEGRPIDRSVVEFLKIFVQK